jgi:hypothetical protein
MSDKGFISILCLGIPKIIERKYSGSFLFVI